MNTYKRSDRKRTRDSKARTMQRKAVRAIKYATAELDMAGLVGGGMS